MILEAVKSKIKTQEDPVSGEGPIHVFQMIVFLYLHMGGKRKGYLLIRLVRVITLLPCKHPSPNTITLKLQYMNLGDTQTYNSQQVAISHLMKLLMLQIMSLRHIQSFIFQRCLSYHFQYSRIEKNNEIWLSRYFISTKIMLQKNYLSYMRQIM